MTKPKRKRVKAWAVVEKDEEKMKVLGMEVRFDKNCSPERLMIVNPKFTQAVDVCSGIVYDFKEGKWKKREEKP